MKRFALVLLVSGFAFASEPTNTHTGTEIAKKVAGSSPVVKVQGETPTSAVAKDGACDPRSQSVSAPAASIGSGY